MSTLARSIFLVRRIEALHVSSVCAPGKKRVTGASARGRAGNFMDSHCAHDFAGNESLDPAGRRTKKSIQLSLL
ncbi:hypothetical protein ACQJ02_29885, partial [Pseudomonas zeae]|uniref:hypothetical protein n=1 Tax=Pseudomonas zeae TaxID=2745510 RepID=UPI003D07829D